MKTFNLKKLYFVVISIVSMIGCAIATGFALFQLAEQKFISDEEFLAGSYNNYEIENCKNSTFTTDVKDTTKSVEVKKTQDEITKCETAAKKKVLDRRAYDHKMGIIGGSVWGGLLFIIFILHFPVMLKKEQENN